MSANNSYNYMKRTNPDIFRKIVEGAFTAQFMASKINSNMSDLEKEDHCQNISATIEQYYMDLFANWHKKQTQNNNIDEYL